MRWLTITLFVLCGWGTVLLSAEEFQDSVGTQLRLVIPGRFEMGARYAAPHFHKDHTAFNADGDDSPIHPVVLTRPFYISKTEVTRAQFRRFVDDSGYVTTAEKSGGGIVGWNPVPPEDKPYVVATFQQQPQFTWRSPGFEQDDSHPVVGVSFEDAQAYCAWLSRQEGASYRLPSEAEWEYAARAGTGTEFSFGDAYRGTIHRFANLGNVELERAFPDRVRRQWLVDVERDPADRFVFTAPVSSYEPNPGGLFDMHGNVWEWCEDRYIDTYYTQFARSAYQHVRKRAIDPVNLDKGTGPGDWRVIRGGSWFNAPIQCRSACRGYFEATDAACYLGFRVVRDAPSEMAAASRQRFERVEAARTAIEQQLGNLLEQRDGRLTLRVRRDQLSSEFLTRLRELDEPIDLRVDGQGRLTAAEIAAILRAPQLRGLELHAVGEQVTSPDFSGLAAHSELELLQINAAYRIDDGLLSYLEGMQKLEQLRLNGEGITDSGLSRLPRLPKLKSLQLLGTQASGAILEKFHGAPLENISFSKLHDDHADKLRGFPLLRELNLSGSPITGRTIEYIATLPRLNFLVLRGCDKLQDEDFQALSRVYSLQRLDLGQTAAGDEAAKALVSLNRLTDLRLGGAPLTDQGFKNLCETISLRNLALESGTMSISDSALTDLWRLINLQTLELHVSGFMGSGLSTLYELPQLRLLVISGPDMTDIALQNIAQCDALEQLTIGRGDTNNPTKLTDAGLHDLARMKSLRELNLRQRDTQITEAGIDELRRSMPAFQLRVQ